MVHPVWEINGGHEKSMIYDSESSNETHLEAYLKYFEQLSTQKLILEKFLTTSNCSS